MGDTGNQAILFVHTEADSGLVIDAAWHGCSAVADCRSCGLDDGRTTASPNTARAPCRCLKGRGNPTYHMTRIARVRSVARSFAAFRRRLTFPDHHYHFVGLASFAQNSYVFSYTTYEVTLTL